MFDIETSIGFLLAKVHQRGYALFKEELDRYDLTPQQFSLLAFLWQQDDLSQAELSAKTQIDRTTMGGLIDRLEKQRLVIRLPHPDDRRAYRIRLTDKGKNLKEPLCDIANNTSTKFLEALNNQEIQILRDILEKLRH